MYGAALELAHDVRRSICFRAKGWSGSLSPTSPSLLNVFPYIRPALSCLCHVSDKWAFPMRGACNVLAQRLVFLVKLLLKFCQVGLEVYSDLGPAGEDMGPACQGQYEGER